MNEPVHDELLRLSLKRELTVEDRLRIEAYLAAHPHRREDWEAEFALGRALRSMPDVPISSNFTARVLGELHRSVPVGDEPKWRVWMRAIQPRLAWAFAAVVVAMFSIDQYRSHQRLRVAQDVRKVSQEIASLQAAVPGPEIFQDFDAIDRLRQVSAVSAVSDDALLTMLQQ